MNIKPLEISIMTDYITLGQLLKLTNIVSTGGEVKNYLVRNKVYINKELDVRRGRKLKDGDLIEINGKSYKIMKV